MRIWDIPPQFLCDTHLKAEHGELHGVWNIHTLGKTGYSHHPEAKRWTGKLQALFLRHEVLAFEMQQRGMNHKSPLDEALATGDSVQREMVNTIEEQIELLRKKGCGCIKLIEEAGGWPDA